MKSNLFNKIPIIPIPVSYTHLDVYKRQPGYNVYPRQINTMLENAIIQEQNTIQIYQHQASCIHEPIIQDVLNRIIKDEQLHVQILESFLYEYNHNLQTDI